MKEEAKKAKQAVKKYAKTTSLRRLNKFVYKHPECYFKYAIVSYLYYIDQEDEHALDKYKYLKVYLAVFKNSMLDINNLELTDNKYKNLFNWNKS